MVSISLLETAALLPFLWTSAAAQFLTQTTQPFQPQTSTAGQIPQPSSGSNSGTACNNSPSLCDRQYNNITHLGAHNSAFVRNESTSFSTAGNHGYSTTVQLSAGVRLLTGQVHSGNGTNGEPEWHMCHSLCSLMDAGSVASWLGEIKLWMDSNPNEVVTLLLVNSDRASSADLGAAFEASGIAEMAYTPPNPGTPPTTWPTLQSLIAANTRLITFVAPLTEPSTQHPYLLDEFTYVFENSFENVDPSNYSCQPDRPTDLQNQPQAAVASNRMFLMNHFLYDQQLFGIETPNATYIQTTNGARGLGSLGTRLAACTDFYTKPPTFVLVDFFNAGPAIASVDRANGVQSAVGRANVPLAPTEPVTGAAAPVRGASTVAVVLAIAIVVGGLL